MPRPSWSCLLKILLRASSLRSSLLRPSLSEPRSSPELKSSLKGCFLINLLNWSRVLIDVTRPWVIQGLIFVLFAEKIRPFLVDFLTIFLTILSKLVALCSISRVPVTASQF